MDATFPRNLEVLYLFLFLRCSWKISLLGAFITGAIVCAASVSTGTCGWSLVCHLLLHLSVGTATVLLSHKATEDSRARFAMVKHVKFAAERSRKWLHTLIPPNVLARIASHSPESGILGTEIRDCVIMFVSLHDPKADHDGEGIEAVSSRSGDDFAPGQNPGSRDSVNFSRQHRAYSDFDDAVSATVLYKYQHVGPWYIITCPNVAEPFDEVHSKHAAERRQRTRPQRTCATDMALLARKLMAIAQHHGFGVRMGIHAGSAAGAVIGKLRAFYCVYGDTVNTASRLCKHADVNHIHVSKDFVVRLNAERVSSATLTTTARRGTAVDRDGKDVTEDIKCLPRGSTLLKGFRQSIETFVIDCRSFERDESGESDLSTEFSRWCQSETGGAEVNHDDQVFNVDAFPASLRRRGSHDIFVDEFSVVTYSDLSSESRALLNAKEMSFTRKLFIFFAFDDPQVVSSS